MIDPCGLSPMASGMSNWNRILLWARMNLFDGLTCTIVTIFLLIGLLFAGINTIDWVIIDSAWDSSGYKPCANIDGACWAVIHEKYRVMLFGFYAYDEHWRPTLAMAIFFLALAVSSFPRLWRWRITIPLWLLTTGAIYILLRGGVLGLVDQESDLWGGLPLTLIIFSAQLALGLPIGILLALGRRSSFPVVSVASVILIEGIRAIPPLALLFFMAVVFPLLLPPGTEVDKVLRIVFAMVLLQACLQAEVVRGGLQAVPAGQVEASTALGIGFWVTLWTVVLPQALRIVIPGLTNQIIQAFKNSTLVIIVGMFDFLNTTIAAISDPEWIRFFVEAYIFAAFVYFCGCSLISAYGRFLEQHFKLVNH